MRECYLKWDCCKDRQIVRTPPQAPDSEDATLHIVRGWGGGAQPQSLFYFNLTGQRNWLRRLSPRRSWPTLGKWLPAEFFPCPMFLML